MKKYSYKLKNLDCPNCANKIETILAKVDGVEDVAINFSTLKLTLKTDREDIETVVKVIVRKIEPDVEVLFGNEKKEEGKKPNKWFPIVRLILGVLFGTLGTYLPMSENVNYTLVILAYVILLSRTAKNALKLLVKSKTINENFLITISCIGAFLVNEHIEGLMVITLYEIGKILEDRAINKTRKSIKELMDIKPEYANLKYGERYRKVLPEKVQIGDIIIVKQGEKIPLDGRIISGTAKLDMSSLTGESDLKEMGFNEEVLSGSINVEGLIEIEVTAEFTNSTVSKILELVENATDKKAKTETFVAKAAKIYTPIVLGLAILVAVVTPMIVQDVTYSDSIYRALIFLVIACPCAIAISVPLSYFSGIGQASKEGILIKGSDYLDELKNIREIVFDKTGTLTTGRFNISSINSFDGRYSEKDILEMIAKGEKFSNHPIAKSILGKLDHELDTSKVIEYKEIAGSGIEYKEEIENAKKNIVEGYQETLFKKLENVIKIGNCEFVGYKDEVINEGETIIYLKKNEDILGNIIIKDEIKEEVKGVISKLRKLGIKLKMFTGDNKETATKIANEIGIDDFKYEMLPTDKYTELENVINAKTRGRVCFIGDGINDSPVLALADIGISMGGIGTESAIEASDVVIMTDNLNKIVEGIHISKKTDRIIKQNLIFAIGTKVLVLTLSAVGIAVMWQAVFADVGVTLITILNSLRILKKGS